MIFLYFLLALASAEIKTLAVLEYHGDGVEQPILRKLSDQARTAASSTLSKDKYQVLSRERLLNDQERLKTCVDASCDLEIGRSLDADYIVTGNVLALDGEYFFTLQLQEPQTGVILHAEDSEASSLGQLIKESKSVSLRLLEVGLEVPDEKEMSEHSSEDPKVEIDGQEKLGIGSIGRYYMNWLTDIDFAKGKTVGLIIVNGFLGILTFLFLSVLAALIIRARPKNAENRFMCVLLIAEGYRVLVGWYNIYPFEASQELLGAVVYYRTGFLYCNLLCALMYLGTIFFYPIKALDVLNRSSIKNHLWWALPCLSFALVYAVVSSNGLLETVGSAYHTKCPIGYEGKDAIITAYADSEMIDGLCYNEYPYVIILPETKALGKLLMLLPLFSAVVSSLLMLGAWRRYEKESNKEEEALEARSLFIGFIGKIIFKGTMLGCIILMTIKFGEFNAAQAPSIAETHGTEVVQLYNILIFSFMYSILFTGMLEGVMFSYAILKNEILGIDEQLRATFTAAMFAGVGAIALLVASEAMEGLIGGGGLIGGLVIGVPLIILRRPIFSLLSKLSTLLMPESFTAAEKDYLAAYEVAIANGLVSVEERKLLSLQAKALGLGKSRVEYIENWYDEQLQMVMDREVQ